MNLYFLVEGLTETEFYPKALNKLLDNKLTRVTQYDLAESNNYFLLGNGGYPYIYTGSDAEGRDSASLKNAILDINSNPVYDYLVLCLDTDEQTIEERTNEFNQYIEKYRKEGVILNEYCQLKLITQNRCIETWFLGNKKIFKNNPTEEPLISYVRYYNIKQNDPELMGRYNDAYTFQDFHHQYLRALFRERKLNYKKGIGEVVGSEEYISSLEKRTKEKSAHLNSLKDFFEFCEYVKSKLI